MGLFDNANFDDPKTMGLLAAAANMLGASGPSTMPHSFGQVAASGLMGGLGGYQAAQENAFKQKLNALKLGEMERQVADTDAIRQAGRDAMRTPAQMALSNGQGPTQANADKIPSMQPGFDAQGFVSRMMAIDPLKGIALQQSMAKETPFGKVDPKDYTPESIAKFAQSRNFGDLMPARKMEIGPGGQVFDPYRIQSGQVLPDPNKPFSVGQNGVPVPNSAYQQYEISKAGAGAARTNVSVNTEKNLLSDIAGGLGKSIVDARGQAQAAAGTINTLGRLNDALNSNKILAGPGTTFKQYGLQVGNILGVNGKDANETLLNTRQAVQSLAQLELDAAQQMKGQGQITESERSIIRRAAAGEIDQMTKSELGLLVGVLDRSARYKIKSYQGQVQPLKSNPNAAPIAPFLDVAEPPPLQSPSAVKSGIKFMGFE